MVFRNRQDAAAGLPRLWRPSGRNGRSFFALQRGVPVASEVADSLAAPLDLVLVRKIGVPKQPELVMGAVVEGPHRSHCSASRSTRNLFAIGFHYGDFSQVDDEDVRRILSHQATPAG